MKDAKKGMDFRPPLYKAHTKQKQNGLGFASGHNRLLTISLYPDHSLGTFG